MHPRFHLNAERSDPVVPKEGLVVLVVVVRVMFDDDEKEMNFILSGLRSETMDIDKEKLRRRVETSFLITLASTV